MADRPYCDTGAPRRDSQGNHTCKIRRMKDELILDFLIKQVGLFKILSDKQVKKIVAGSRVQSYVYNEAVVRFGEDATFYGVLLEGALSVSVIGEGGLRKEIGQLKAGDTFGDMVLMSGDKNMIDLIAQKQSLVLRIPVALFNRLLLPNQPQ